MLDQVKSLLGLSDESQDEKLRSVITLTSARLASLLGVKDVPEEMQYIAIEASIRRFNRIGRHEQPQRGRRKHFLQRQ